MSKEEDNKATVGRWFTDFWGKTCNLGIVDELAAPDMLLQYSLHAPRKGHADIKAFMADFRKAFPDLGFSGAIQKRPMAVVFMAALCSRTRLLKDVNFTRHRRAFAKPSSPSASWQPRTYRDAINSFPPLRQGPERQ